MKIGLLECDHVADRFRPIAGDYREMFPALFARVAPELVFRNFDVCNGELPPDEDDCDGYLCTGSRFSVYETHDWLEKLKGFVRRLRAEGRPFVGICFGHQLLAESLGGRVAKADVGWGVGVHALEITQAEDWMNPAASRCRLQYMHQDQVLRLPEASVLLGRSDHCPAAMFRVGETMLGIQAHPEFPAAYAEALLRDRVERIGPERTQAALDSLPSPTDETTVARWIVRFLKKDDGIDEKTESTDASVGDFR